MGDEKLVGVEKPVIEADASKETVKKKGNETADKPVSNKTVEKTMRRKRLSRRRCVYGDC